MYLALLQLEKRVLYGPDSCGVASAEYNLGRFYSRYDNSDKAEVMYLDAMRIGKLVDDHRLVAKSLFALGNLYTGLGRYEEGKDMYVDALRILKAVHGLNHPDVTRTQSVLGDLHKAQGKYCNIRTYDATNFNASKRYVYIQI